ncbi:hypothetical protein AAES_140997 [Amazona aestiva]|uniref:Uncharacterized protein n=1 Tax=Amazona aestiva TaxID=12930 RepID=A0A0Q3M0D0_AMAAE|nr:hypothetical protein AAES_140997 [Amazona aestiva]
MSDPNIVLLHCYQCASFGIFYLKGLKIALLTQHWQDLDSQCEFVPNQQGQLIPDQYFYTAMALSEEVQGVLKLGLWVSKKPTGLEETFETRKSGNLDIEEREGLIQRIAVSSWWLNLTMVRAMSLKH